MNRRADKELHHMRRNKPIIAGLAGAAMVLSLGVPAFAATSVVDAIGDTAYNGPRYVDIVGAELSDATGTFTFRMMLAAAIPSAPALPPPGVATISWAFPIDTDPTTFPAGEPFAPGNGQLGPAEFNIPVVWDGSQFSATLLDRRPLLDGGEAIRTPLTFEISGTLVQVTVPAALLDDPPSFRWGAVTVYSSASPGSNSGRHFCDGLEPFYVAWP
jgi:hypothetical protein